MRRVNLLRAHGSPGTHLYSRELCRCVPCRAAKSEKEHRLREGRSEEQREEAAAYGAAYSAAHRAERVVYDAVYRAAHRDKAVARKRQRKYGLLPGEWDAMLAAQGCMCAICGTTEPGGKYGKWHTDHDHATGLTRGLLCQHCNTGLGQFRDNPEYLAAAIEYLAGATP